MQPLRWRLVRVMTVMVQPLQPQACARKHSEASFQSDGPQLHQGKVARLRRNRRLFLLGCARCGAAPTAQGSATLDPGLEPLWLTVGNLWLWNINLH